MSTSASPDGPGSRGPSEFPAVPGPTRRTIRMLSAALVAVLFVLSGLALWDVVALDRSASRLERSGDLVQAYLTLHRAVAVQDLVEHEYDEDPGRRNRERFERTIPVVLDALATLERDGTSRDRALAGIVATQQRRYVRAIHRFFDAVDAGDEARAEAIDDREVNPPSRVLQVQVNLEGPRHAGASLREIDALRATQSTVLRGTMLAVLFGLLAVSALVSVLRSLRRRLEEAGAAELERISQMAMTDSLTGIGNRRAFEEQLERALSRCRRDGSTLALLMVDADRLKQVNALGGHHAGDRYLQAIASALREAVPGHGGAYRIGGDEFAAVLPGASAWDAFNAAQDVHHLLGDRGVTVTAGVADTATAGGREELMRHADVALREGKRGGQATVCWSPVLDGAAEERPAEPGGPHGRALAMALARAVDAKDSFTRSHCETVAELCRWVAAELGLAASRVDALHLAGLVHDVGKIGVPDAILQKPARLTPEEFAVIKGHTTAGHRILIGTELNRQASWVLHHHERWDGTGYPEGLRGDEIPLEARILHVADAFEAMTSDRPYRAGIADADAFEELRRHAGTQFDAACVDALIRAVGDAGGAGRRRTGATAEQTPGKLGRDAAVA